MVTTFLTTGCTKRDHKDCQPPNNLILKLDLQNSEADALFAEKVNSIDVFVYDIGNYPAIHKRVTKQRQGWIDDLAFAVAPGRYRIVCWANIGDETRIVGPESEWPLDDCFLETTSNQTGSPLYYAPDDRNCKVTVLPNRVTAKEMLFVRAHRTVRVYLKGYEEIYKPHPPLIALSNVPIRTDFFMKTRKPRKNYQTEATIVETDHGTRMTTAFNFLIAPLTDDMLLEIIEKESNEIVTQINLKQYVDENEAEIDDPNDFGIEIRYLMDGSVEIVPTQWKEIYLQPQW